MASLPPEQLEALSVWFLVVLVKQHPFSVELDQIRLKSSLMHTPHVYREFNSAFLYIIIKTIYDEFGTIKGLFQEFCYTGYLF
jgi:hypothetical protein